MYCGKCGAQLPNGANACPYCGTMVNGNANLNQNVNNQPVYNNQPMVEDKPNMALNIVVLLVMPLLGVILYFVWKEQTPKRAKSVLTYGLIGFGINFGLVIISTILGVVAGLAA